MSHTIISDLAIRYFNTGDQPKFLLRLETCESNVFPQTPHWNTRIIGSYLDLSRQIGRILLGIHNGDYRTKGNASVLGMLNKFQEAFNNAREISMDASCEFSVSGLHDSRNDEIVHSLQNLLSAEELELMQKRTRYASEEIYFEGSLSSLYPIAEKVKGSKVLENCFQIFRMSDAVIHSTTPNPLISDAESLRIQIEVPVLETTKLKQAMYMTSHCFITNVDSNTVFTTDLVKVYFASIFPSVLVSGTFASAKNHIQAFMDFYSELNLLAPDDNYRYIMQGFIPENHWYGKEHNLQPNALQRVEVVDNSTGDDIQILNVLSNLQLLNGQSLPHKFPAVRQISLF